MEDLRFDPKQPKARASVSLLLKLQLTFNIILVSGVQHGKHLHNLQSEAPGRSRTHLYVTARSHYTIIDCVPYAVLCIPMAIL